MWTACRECWMWADNPERNNDNYAADMIIRFHCLWEWDKVFKGGGIEVMFSEQLLLFLCFFVFESMSIFSNDERVIDWIAMMKCVSLSVPDEMIVYTSPGSKWYVYANAVLFIWGVNKITTGSIPCAWYRACLAYISIFSKADCIAKLDCYIHAFEATKRVYG